MEASCHFTSSIVLWFNSGLLSLYFYVIACYLSCFIKGKYFQLHEVYRQVLESIIVPLLQGVGGRGKRNATI